jgi:Tfp pilus assembly protein PilF
MTGILKVMTLVVGRKIGNSIGIVSDTLLVHPNEGRRPLDRGVLKTAIVYEGLCVSFAGTHKCADAALKSLDFKGNHIDDVAGIVEHFLGWHRKERHMVDFILAFGPPHSRLIVVKNGMAGDTDSAWIGLQTAFSRFQSFMLEPGQLDLPPQPPSDAAVVSLEAIRVPRGDDAAGAILPRLKKAMARVIADSDIEDVGGIVTMLATDEGGFKFIDYVDFLTHAIPLERIPAQMAPVPAGTAAQGGYSFNFMRGVANGHAEVAAIYFKQGGFGFVYLPENGGFARPHPVTDVSAVDFVDHVRERYGVEVNCAFATSAGYYNRGVLYDQRGEIDLAIADYTRAIERDRTNADAYHNRGADHLRKGQYDLAVADLTQVIELNPDYATACSNRALAYKHLGLPENAIADYTRLITLNPNSAEPCFARAVLFGEIGGHERAIADYTSTIQIDPRHTKAYNNRALLYLELGLSDKAIADLRRAVEIDPTDPDYRQNFAIASRALVR